MAKVIPLTAREKKPRASKPKTRNGCVTCKIRRVKCDEAKPSCSRYLDSSTQQSATQSIRPLQPKISPDFQPILWEPSNALFKNEKDYRYFRLFCNKTAHQLDGIVPSDLWSRLMLQACERNQSVRHGIIAIAALDLTSQLTRDQIDDSGEGFPEPGGHYQFALEQYSHAIRHNLQNATSKRETDLATTLVTCIVTICFEAFHGNHDSAFSQISTGLRMIEQAVKTENLHRAFVKGISSSILSTVDEDLIYTFIRLDLQAMTFVNGRTIDSRTFSQDFGLADLNGMPTRFSNFNEARNYFSLVLLQFLHFIRSTIKQTRNNHSMESIHLLSCLDTSMSLGKGRVYYLALIKQWHETFEPIAIPARAASGTADFLAATNLEFKYQAARLTFETLPAKGVPEMKDFMPYFKKIVSLGRQILDHPDVKLNKRLFTFDHQIILPLYVAGWRCPHAETRRQAIALLFSAPRRECLWDGVMAAKIAEWIMNIEEEHLEGDYVPKEMRMTQMSLEFDAMTRTAHVAGVMPKKGTDELVAVKVVLTW